jgi:hypothetical protein
MKNWMCDSVELDLANTFATPIKHFDTDDGYRFAPPILRNDAARLQTLRNRLLFYVAQFVTEKSVFSYEKPHKNLRKYLRSKSNAGIIPALDVFNWWLIEPLRNDRNWFCICANVGHEAAKVPM